MNRLHPFARTLSAFAASAAMAGFGSVGYADAPPTKDGSRVKPAKELTRHSELSLMSDAATVTPGQTFTLGVRFAIDKGWHMYAPAQNVTGEPPIWELTLPDGWIAGDALWPVPSRHELPGDILDHIYENSLLILIPVHVPAVGAVDRNVKIDIKSDWMVCEEACVFESGEASLAISLGGVPARSKDARAIEAARGQVAGHAGKAVDLQVEDSGVRIIVAGATHVAYIPDAQSTVIENLLEGGEVTGETLSLIYGTYQGTPVVSGIVRASMKDGSTRAWRVSGSSVENAEAPHPGQPAKDSSGGAGTNR